MSSSSLRASNLFSICGLLNYPSGKFLVSEMEDLDYLYKILLKVRPEQMAEKKQVK